MKTKNNKIERLWHNLTGRKRMKSHQEDSFHPSPLNEQPLLSLHQIVATLQPSSAPTQERKISLHSEMDLWKLFWHYSSGTHQFFMEYTDNTKQSPCRIQHGTQYVEDRFYFQLLPYRADNLHCRMVYWRHHEANPSFLHAS